MLTGKEQKNPDFNEIMEMAKGNIQNQYPSWTNFNLSDSGMVLLELFAFMTEAQQFHLGQIGESHYKAFLNLLGMCPKGFRAASVYARAEGIEKPFLLYRGTKAMADTLVFEADETLYMERSHILLEEETPFYPFGENPDDFVYYDIRLQYELEKEVVHTLYFDLYDGYPVARNPADNDFIPFVELQLFFYDGEKYRECEMLKDTTLGLLQSGRIQFRLPDRMGKLEKEYRLRLTAAGEYDTAPFLNGIYFNMIPFLQKDTKIECRQFFIKRDKKKFYEIDADSWLAVMEDTEIYIRTEKGFKQIMEFSSYVHEKKRHFVFAEELFREIEGDISICLVSYQKGLPKKEYVYYGDGMPNQHFFLPDSNVLGSCFLIWVEEDRDYYISWVSISDFAKAGRDDRCYVIDEKKGILKFGNGKQGIAPKGRIKIVSYATCAGSSGNIHKKQLNTFCGEKGAEFLFNPYPAVGGKEPESVDECLQRYEEKNKVRNRAVTGQDYEEVIRQTPGLRIKKVKVFPESACENGLEAVIQPFTNGQRILKGMGYDNNIIRLLEKKKMLGTHIIVRKPEYIGISLRLEIKVKSRYLQVKTKVEEHIKQYFEEEMDFGKTIVYSRIFGYIDTLPETAGIYALEIQAGGKGVIRDDNRDIHLPFYGMAYLEELEVRCVLADET